VVSLTRRQVNDIFGWVDDFAPRDPERIRQDIKRLEDDLHELRCELRDAARWYAQRDAYNAIAKHATGKPLSVEETDAMHSICSQPYEDHEVKP
jgi:hypothetical protein